MGEGGKRSAGKIIIPGGRFSGGGRERAAVPVEVREVEDGDNVDGDGGGKAEWRINGAGRLDVRGFRELKI